MSHEPNRLREITPLLGAGLIISTFLWWGGLQAWATAQYGYLDVDVIGATPLLWVLLVAMSGVAFLTRVLPRRHANLSVAGMIVLVALALASPNIGANLDDGISAAGWLMAAASFAQVLVIVLMLVTLHGTDTTQT